MESYNSTEENFQAQLKACLNDMIRLSQHCLDISYFRDLNAVKEDADDKAKDTIRRFTNELDALQLRLTQLYQGV